MTNLLLLVILWSVIAVGGLVWFRTLPEAIAPVPAPEPLGTHVAVIVPVDDLFHAAREIVQIVDVEEVTAGWQNRWHQQSGRLVKAFPGASPRAISRAIEAAYQEQ